MERSLKPGEEHFYRIDLQAGDYVRITIAPQGLNLAAAASDPAGQILVEVDTVGSDLATEAVSILARETGAHGLAVRPVTGDLRLGGYRLEVGVPRPARPEDVLRAEAELVTARAWSHFRARKPEDLIQASGLLHEALALRRRLGDRPGEAAALEDLGRVHLLRGDAAAARLSFETSLDLRRSLGDRPGAASALNQIGRASRRLSEPERARAAFEEALSLLRENPDPLLEATVLNNLAVLFQETGDWRGAFSTQERALELYRRQGSVEGEAKAQLNLGYLSSQLGDPGAALGFLQRALASARQLKNRSLEAEVLGNLGDLEERLGRFRAALEHAGAALAIYRELEDKPRQGVALNNTGDLLLTLGSLEAGRDVLEQALALQTGPREQSVTLVNLARAAILLGRPEEAAEHLRSALSRQRETQDLVGEASSLYTLARLDLDASRLEPAERSLREALEIFRRIGAPGWEASTLRALGVAHAIRGDGESAERAFHEALRIGEKLGDLREQGRILWEKARAEEERGDLDGARRDLEAALERFESLRAEVGGGLLRAAFLSSVSEAYDLYVEILQGLHDTRPGQGWDARAFAAAERSRARALLDFLSRSEIEVRHADPSLLAEEARLRQELAARANLRLDLLRDAGKAEELAAVDKEIESLTAEHRLLEARLRAGDPRYAALEDPSIDVAAVRTLLGEDTVLLEYSLGDPRSWLWVVTQDSLKTFELPGRARIEELALRVHEHLRSPNPAGAGEERTDLEELSRMLLGAALPEIGDKRLAIVADGALQYIPFAALPVPAPDGGMVPLVVRHEVAHLPSAAVLREIRRAAAGRPRPEADLAILADPVYESTDPRVRSAAKRPAASLEAQIAQTTPAPAAAPAEEDILRSLYGATRAESLARLSWSRREAERIAAAAEGRDLRLALDFQASRDLALSPDLRRYKVLHFATHGFLDAGHPELSGLALSQWDEQGQPRDGFLRLQDVYNLELHADLVVLSGCETALGKRLRGEGLLSLTHGFLHAGASGVVASLWEVRDRATAELMERFYRALYRDGLAPAAALRAAQVSLWKERAWRDPYYWAAFTMQGDWR